MNGFVASHIFYFWILSHIEFTSPEIGFLCFLYLFAAISKISIFFWNSSRSAIRHWQASIRNSELIAALYRPKKYVDKKLGVL